MKNETRTRINGMTKWLASLAIVHLLANIVYAILLAVMISDLLSDELYQNAFNLIFWFGMAVIILYAIYYTVSICKDVDIKNDIKAYMKENNFTTLRYFKDRCLKDAISRLGVYALWHIPLIVVCYAMSMGPIISTFLGRIWIVELGAVAVTGSVILGVLINLVVMFVAYSISLMVGINSLYKDIKENSCT